MTNAPATGMSIDSINEWISHALGILFMASIVVATVALVLFGGVSVIRLRHC